MSGQQEHKPENPDGDAGGDGSIPPDAATLRARLELAKKSKKTKKYRVEFQGLLEMLTALAEGDGAGG